MLLNKPHCGVYNGEKHHSVTSSILIGFQPPCTHRRASTRSGCFAKAVCVSRGYVASRDAPQHRSSRQIACAAVDGSTQEIDEVAAETKARVGWDPAGVLPPLESLGTTDHFSRRAHQKQQQKQQHAPSSADGSSCEQQQTPCVEQQPAAAYSTAVRSTQEAQQQQEHQQPAQQKFSVAAAAAAEPAVAEPAAAAPQAVAAPSPPAASPAADVQQQPAAASPAVFKATDPFERIPAKWLVQGGIPAADTTAYDRPAFIAKLAEKFIPIDLGFPGLRIVNFDPAVFTIEGFMTPEECDSWQQHALDSGCLQQSKIGGGNAASAAGGGVNAYGSRRTSSSLLMDPQTQEKSPGLTALMHTMQQRGQKLLAHLDDGRSWGPAGKLPAGGQYCYENPQVARYLPGQHFLAHEDAFPALLAAANGFQRHATLLLYLNNAPQGGATHFDHLGISVQPQQGMALLFFPAYANGTADPRSLHTAQDAVDTKWVMQQWIARGYPVPKAVLKAVKVAAAAAAPHEPVREVFRVPVTSNSSSGKASSTKKSGRSKKGFSRR